MKKNQLILIALLVCSVAIICFGCVVRSPSGPPDPITGAVPLASYVPDPRINSLSNTVAGAAAMAAPINPYAGITDTLLKAGFGLAGMVAGWLAQRKNTQTAKNEATQKTALLTTVIKGVEDAGTASVPVKTAIQQRASSTGMQTQLDEIVQRVT